MKYTFTAHNTKTDDEVTVHISVRSDASLKTVVMKCLQAMTNQLNQELDARIQWPNIWINGAVGAIHFMDESKKWWCTELFRDDNEILIFA